MSPPLGALLPPGCEWEWGDPREASAPLYPEEQATLVRAVEKRQREFAKGRECARRALARLGYAPAPLLNGGQREPLWPPGAVGSLTHTDTYCAVIVASARDYESLGVDAELADPLEPGIIRRVCVAEERQWLDQHPNDAAVLGRLVFSIKEAIYKCQFPLSRQFLGFSDVSVTIDGAPGPSGRFSGRLGVDAGPFPAGYEFSGRWARGEGLLLSATWLVAGRHCRSERLVTDIQA